MALNESDFHFYVEINNYKSQPGAVALEILKNIPAQNSGMRRAMLALFALTICLHLSVPAYSNVSREPVSIVARSYAADRRAPQLFAVYKKIQSRKPGVFNLQLQFLTLHACSDRHGLKVFLWISRRVDHVAALPYFIKKYFPARSRLTANPLPSFS